MLIKTKSGQYTDYAENSAGRQFLEFKEDFYLNTANIEYFTKDVNGVYYIKFISGNFVHVKNLNPKYLDSAYET